MGELENSFLVLGLRADATWEQVVDAWRLLSKQNHPDTKIAGSEDYLKAEEVQKELNLSYERLKVHFGSCSSVAALQASCKNADEFFSAGFNASVSDSGGAGAAFSAAHFESEYARASAYADSSSEKYDLLRAVSILKNIANLGYSKAQFKLGHIYFDGILKDLAQAAYWWQRAAETGNLNAQFNLALLYERGWGISKDQTKAMQWFERAARSGDSEACVIVSKCGVNTFLRKTNYWFRGV